MMPYLITFLITYSLVYIAEREQEKNPLLSKLMLFMGCICLAMLAALRDECIGTDVLTYVNRYFTTAVYSNDLIKYLNSFTTDAVEPLYMTLNWLIARVTDNVRIWYFIIDFWDATFVFIFLWENRKKCSIMWGVFLYTIILYNVSYNAVRQIMAVVVCLYSFNAARDKHLLKFVLLQLVAFLIHRSSVLMILVYPLLRIFEKKNVYQKNRAIFNYSMIMGIGLLLINTVVQVLINIGLFPSKFTHYIGNNFTFSKWSAFAFVIPILIILLMYYKKYYKNDSMNAIMILFVIVWPMVAQLDSVSDQFGRMAYYFVISNIYLYAQLPKLSKICINKMNITVLKFASVIFLCLYWYVCFVVWNTGMTVPYIFG